MKHLGILTALSTAIVAVSGTALADNDFSLHLEPGVAIPLSAPQSNLYDPGLALGAKGMFTLTPNFSIGPSVSAVYLPRQVDNGQNAGVLWQFGGSARLQGDRRVTNRNPITSLFNPWIDVDVTAAVTGDLVLPAFDVGVGAELPFDRNHIAWVGPFVRFTHVFETSNTSDNALLNTRDVNIIQMGLSFSFDTPTTPRTRNVTQVVTVVEHDVVPCPHCNVVVSPPVDKLDLSERVYFDFDSATLRWESRDKLDSLVKVINAHPNLDILIEGNASSDGQKKHNVQLSAERAAVVRDYLATHGVVDQGRLLGLVHGVNHPAAPNSTKEGRERNRRVEFEFQLTSVERQAQGK
jgi:outer membrane protein OmpA-like peptidoglycan-associated protein